MTDKVQKIREEAEMVINRRLNLLNGDYFDLNKETDGFTNEIMDIIDSLQEESVSEELEEAASRYAKEEYNSKSPATLPDRCRGCYAPLMYAFKAGSKWQKENLWKPTDGEDLPEIDREVIAILDYDFGHYKVVYAHRPNPNGWNGTNIDTGEK